MDKENITHHLWHVRMDPTLTQQPILPYSWTSNTPPTPHMIRQVPTPGENHNMSHWQLESPITKQGEKGQAKHSALTQYANNQIGHRCQSGATRVHCPHRKIERITNLTI